MTNSITISADPRETRGKNEARRLRVLHKIPAVVYGARKESLAVSVSPKEVGKILHSTTGHNTIFTLDVTGVETTPVMIVDWQNDPIKGSLLHADLKRIDLTQRLAVKIPVYTEGDARGVKEQDGLLEIVTRVIEIECLPDEIPERFTVNVSELMMGQSKRASDVELTGSMKLVSNPESVIAHVVAMREEEVVAPTEAVAVEGAEGTPTEPEVIKKGKKEEEEGEAEDKGKKK
jgi:large subunit ribosomal protein L25